MKDWKVKVKNHKDFVNGYTKGKQDTLEEVEKMIDDYYPSWTFPSKLKENYEVVFKEIMKEIKQQLEKLGEK